MKLDKYITCYPNEMQQYYQKGYEFVAVYSEYYMNGGGTTNSSGSVSGTLNGANVNLNMSLPVPGYQGVNATARVIMQLRGVAETLFGNNKP